MSKCRKLFPLKIEIYPIQKSIFLTLLIITLLDPESECTQYSLTTYSFCTLTPSIIEEQIRLSPPSTPPNYNPFKRVISNNEYTLQQKFPLNRNCTSPNGRVSIDKVGVCLFVCLFLFQG